MALNLMFIALVFLLFSNSVGVDALRPLKDDDRSSSSSLVTSSMLGRAYSGPSHRGRGH